FPVAKEVHQAIRGSDAQFKKLENHNNSWQHPMVSCFEKKKKKKEEIQFSNSFGIGNLKLVWFLMNSMFLQIECTGSLNNQAIPTLLFELQARWVAKVLSGKVALPTEEYMASSVEKLYQHMDETGRPKHHTHKLQHDKSQISSKSRIKGPPLGFLVLHLHC
ncbi:flavin-containing monooxygenase fmo gs-ox5, partial [Quercus suber]